jgi:hypothetical protein
LLLGSSETIPSGLSAFIAYPPTPVDGLLDRTRENAHDPLGPRSRKMMSRGVGCKGFVGRYPQKNAYQPVVSFWAVALLHTGYADLPAAIARD